MDQASHNGLVAGSSPAGPTNIFKDLAKIRGLLAGSLNLRPQNFALPTPLSLLLAAGLGLSLAGCEAKPDPSAAAVNNGVGRDEVHRKVWTDPDTGCQYLFWRVGVEGYNSFNMLLTPRLGRDGKPVCSPLPAAQGGR